MPIWLSLAACWHLTVEMRATPTLITFLVLGAIASLSTLLVAPEIAVGLVFGTFIVALWTSERYADLMRRSSVRSLDAVRRFSSGSHRSIYDPETGFCTSWYFLLRLEEEIARSSRNAAPFSILYVEPTHRLGERMRRELHLSLERGFRTADLIGRMGDERFLVLLVDSSRDGTAAVAERFAANLGHSVVIRSAAYPEDGQERTELIKAVGADMGVAFPETEAIWTPGAKSKFDDPGRDRDAA